MDVWQWWVMGVGSQAVSGVKSKLNFMEDNVIEHCTRPGLSLAVFSKLILRRKRKEREGNERKVKMNHVLETFLGEKGKETEGK